VPSQASFTDAPVVTAHPCAGSPSHRRPGGSSWFTVLPQRCWMPPQRQNPGQHPNQFAESIMLLLF